jgi:hypothetical protein
MLRLTVVLLGLILVASCASPPAEPEPASTPTRTINLLAKAARDADYGAFFDLQSSEALGDERARWEIGRTSGKVATTETFRTFFINVMRRRAARDPGWSEHLKGMKVLSEEIGGDNALVRVRFGKPKQDEEHDAALVRRDGVWKLRNWK